MCALCFSRAVDTTARRAWCWGISAVGRAVRCVAESSCERDRKSGGGRMAQQRGLSVQRAAAVDLWAEAAGIALRATVPKNKLTPVLPTSVCCCSCENVRVISHTVLARPSDLQQRWLPQGRFAGF